MTPVRPSSAAVHGIHAPAARLTWQAALLVAIGLSSAFLIVIASFAVATTLIWPG
ncbi:hypothetical protein [Albidovulum sp.]|jgi:hypothetical protein|uniref:hypothetical protein n=1 Tax=Albidovulum sp. TaxID=1872424 RepID=UPI00302C9C7A